MSEIYGTVNQFYMSLDEFHKWLFFLVTYFVTMDAWWKIRTQRRIIKLESKLSMSKER